MEVGGSGKSWEKGMNKIKVHGTNFLLIKKEKIYSPGSPKSQIQMCIILYKESTLFPLHN